MRCCARRCTTTCCPGERAELHLALARVLERTSRRARRARAPSSRRRSPITTPQPATSPRRSARWSARRRAAETRARLRRGGGPGRARARAVAARARSPSAVELDHVELLVDGGAAHTRAAAIPLAREVLLQEALGELDPERDPRRYSDAAGSLARPNGRSTAGRKASRRPSGRLRCCPPATKAASGALCCPGLRGRGSCAAASGRR